MKIKKIGLIGSTAASMIGFRKSLIEVLASRGLTVYCFAIDYDENSRNKIRLIGGIPIDYSLQRSKIGPILLVFEIICLANILKNYKIDCIFSFITKPSVVAMIASKVLGINKRIAMLEGLGSTFTNFDDKFFFSKEIVRYCQAFLIGFSFKFSQKVIFLNKDDPKDLRKYYGIIPIEKVKILNGIGVEFNNFKKTTKNKNKNIRIIFIGRLIKEKGIYDFIYVAKFLSTIYPNCSFSIVGDIDPGNPSSLTVDELNIIKLNSDIFFLGYLKNVYSELDNSDVLVLPSYREGFPRVVMEAMSMGCPVVGYNVPGTRDSIVNGLTGFLVERGDKSHLISCLDYLINNPKILNQMGNNAFEYAQKHFNSEVKARELADLILD